MRLADAYSCRYTFVCLQMYFGMCIFLPRNLTDHVHVFRKPYHQYRLTMYVCIIMRLCNYYTPAFINFRLYIRYIGDVLKE